MPFITISNGLTLQVPTRGTTDWDTEFLNNFATPISEHQHTGSGDGAQLGGGSIQDDSLDDRKLRLRTNQYFRSRNAAGDGDINLLKANSSDTIVLGPETITGGEIEIALEIKTAGLKTKRAFSFTNNQSSATDITGVQAVVGTDNALRVKYSIKREGTANLYENGTLDVYYNGVGFDCVQEFYGDDSGVSFSVTAAGQLQYTSSDNAGSTSETMYLLTERFGD